MVGCTGGATIALGAATMGRAATVFATGATGGEGGVAAGAAGFSGGGD